MSELSVGSLSGLAANSYVIDVASGSQLTQPGMILQVAQAVKTDTFTTTSTSLVDVTGLSVTITPSSATSKILVTCEYYISNSVTNQAAVAQLLRDSTSIYSADSAGSRPVGSGVGGGWNSTDLNRFFSSFTNVFLDSPATTSAVTYKLQLRATGSTATLGRTGYDADSVAGPRLPSSITVMEVAG